MAQNVNKSHIPVKLEVKISHYTFAIVMAAGIMPALAGPEVEIMRDCANAADPAWCESLQVGFPEVFRKAHDGDYQAQRNIAYCLSTGCDGATVVDVEAGCAWRIIIMAAADPAMDATDARNYDEECGRLGSAGKRHAMTLAKAKFRAIYGRKMPEF